MPAPPPPAIKLAMLACLVLMMLLDRFGLRLSEAFSIAPGMIGMYMLLGALLWTGAARLSPTALLLYVALVLISGTSFLVNTTSSSWRGAVSMNSWLLMLMLYAPFVVRLAPSRDVGSTWHWLLRWYMVFAAVSAVFGIAQYLGQFVFRPLWLIDYTPYIPDLIRGSGTYNTSNAVGTAFKSNGFFLREASGFSFYMAFALVTEWCLFRRKPILLLLAAGLVVSYSGSGIAVLLAATMVPFGFRTMLRAAVGVITLVVLYFTAGEALNLTYTVGRVHEFGSDRSSAYCRFILPAKTVARRIDDAPWVSVIGHGPGTMQKMTSSCETTYAKMVFEYGMLGTLVFVGTMLVALGRSWVPLRMRVGVLVYWTLLGGHLLGPEALLLIFLLCAMWPNDRPATGLPPLLDRDDATAKRHD